ncbi:MAG: hypothetical protein H0T78_05035 [Longispora sp.]|nr:hypothetical protein [Longispora sp. (in: high G+C Gram-positive bacteria)]
MSVTRRMNRAHGTLPGAPDPGHGIGTVAPRANLLRVRNKTVTRRGVLAVLTGISIAGLTGCGSFESFEDDQRSDPGPHPLAEHLRASTELALAYEASFAAEPGLIEKYSVVRDNHWAHADALATATRQPRPSRTLIRVNTGTRDSLLHAERVAAQRAYDATLTLPGTYTALLGSIAASRATHVDVLS